MREANAPPLDRATAGLPEGQIVQVIHNLGSGKTIVEVALAQTPPLRRLFWRPANQVAYQALLDLGEGLSIENCVSAEGPFLFARQVRWSEAGNGFGCSTVALLRVDLVGQPEVQELDLGDILPGNAAVSRLLRVNDAGSKVVATVLFKQPKSDGTGRRVEYHICVLDLAARSLTKVDELAGVTH